MAEMDSEGGSGEFGVLSKGQEKMFEQALLDEMRKTYGDIVSDIQIIGSTDLGYVLKMEFQESGQYNGYVYYILKGYKIYIIGGFVVDTDSSKEDQNILIETLDQIYSTVEVGK